MRLMIDRAWKKADYTISRFFVNDERWCECLEDTDRGLTSSMSISEVKAKKVYGRTAIPSGKYQVTLTYSPKFRKYLPLVNDVKCFSGIRFHAGNTNRDTEGCILLGKNTKVGMVTNSAYWTDRLIGAVRNAIDHGEIVTLEII